MSLAMVVGLLLLGVLAKMLSRVRLSSSWSLLARVLLVSLKAVMLEAILSSWLDRSMTVLPTLLTLLSSLRSSSCQVMELSAARDPVCNRA